jgi:hypothetical protein
MSKPLPPNRPEPGAGERRPAAPVPAAPAPKPKAPKPPRGASPWPWRPISRVAVSALIVFHVVAVFAAPWFIQTSYDLFVPALPPGRIPRDAQGREIPPDRLDPREYPPQRPIFLELLASRETRFPVLFHYANLLYINNGYDFFSPDPSVNHLIRYEVFDDAGASIAKGTLPNTREQWPRLLYHRYMMLVEQSGDETGWETRIADGLLRRYDGRRVKLEKVRHHLLTPAEVLAGRRINEDSTYEVLGVLEHQRSDTPHAAANGETVAVPGGGQ